jgi:uncharacterized membrane protein YeaQ/YmgE (transglycosylase-associated protein family)
MLIGIALWALVGLVVGFIFSNIVNLHGDDPRLGVGVGVLAAVVGGWVFSWISGTPAPGFHIWTLVTAAIVALVAVAAWHLIRSRGTHERPTVRRSY